MIGVKLLCQWHASEKHHRRRILRPSPASPIVISSTGNFDGPYLVHRGKSG